jgi:hypothetical protein
MISIIGIFLKELLPLQVEIPRLALLARNDTSQDFVNSINSLISEFVVVFWQMKIAEM